MFGFHSATALQHFPFLPAMLKVLCTVGCEGMQSGLVIQHQKSAEGSTSRSDQIKQQALYTKPPEIQSMEVEPMSQL